MRSFCRSIPWSLRNSSAIQSMMRWSKSSPPRKVSPLVALTSKTPSPNSRIDISKVPPPRSKTAIFLVFLFIQSVGQRCRRRLIDDAQDVETGDPASILGGLPLAVVEICRHGNNRLGYFFAEVVFSRLLHFLQNERRNFRRAVLFVADFDPGRTVGILDHLVGQNFARLAYLRVVIPASHQALNCENGIGGIGNRLPFRDLSDQALARVGKSHNRRSGAASFRVGDYDRIVTFHNRDSAISRSEINSDYFGHCLETSQRYHNHVSAAFNLTVGAAIRPAAAAVGSFAPFLGNAHPRWPQQAIADLIAALELVHHRVRRILFRLDVIDRR